MAGLFWNHSDLSSVPDSYENAPEFSDPEP